jgi:antitoxin component of MazEF toxin-antitoxin module
MFDSDVEIIVFADGEMILRPYNRHKTIQELFADYEGGVCHSDELDWGGQQGEEVW